MDLQIRKIVPAELTAFSAVVRDAAEWLQLLHGFDSWTVAQLSPQALKARHPIDAMWAGFWMDFPVATLIIQEEDNVYWPDDPAGEALYLHKLAVTRPYHGMGLAPQMLQFAAEYAKQANRPYLRLDCRANRPRLRKFYEKNGFEWVDMYQLNQHLTVRYQKAI